MGNYNKWRKILTILMIINICFVLFAKFSKVFGVVSQTFFNINIVNSDDILLSDNVSFTPVNYDSAEYDLYTLLVKTTPNSNELIFDGYLITVHSGDTLKIQYRNNTYYPTLRISAPNKVCIVPFSGTVQNGVFPRNNFESQLNSYASSSMWWRDYEDKSFAGYTQAQFSSSYPSMIKYSNNSYIDFYNQNNELIDSYTPFVLPCFDNVTEIENGNPDGVFISPNSYGVDDTLYFHLLEVVYSTPNSNNDTIFYYMPKIFALDKSSRYLKYYLNNEDMPYYSIPRSALGLSPDSSYLYVLSNSSESYNNSVGIIQEDNSSGVYDVISSDTTGILSYQETIDNNLDNIDDFLRDNNVGDYNLNYNNENSELTSMNNGFFTRLLSLVSDTFDYNLSDDTFISIPMPHSNKTIELHSNILYNNVNGVIRTIIEAFWFYIFGFYVFRFINKLYIAISSGSILDTFSSSDEAITNNML